jgi:glycine/D-amino acid oxidase-like deaminating enzyme
MTQHSDFIVIGGGIAGVSAGARLAALGKVTLLEAEAALGYHASGRSAALFVEGYGNPAVRALTAASHAHHLAEGTLTDRGLMLVAGPERAEAFEDEHRDMQLTPISLDEAQARMPILNPDVIRRAAYSDQIRDIDTDLLLQGFARRLRRNGEVVTDARVTAIARTATGWRVTAGGLDYDAPKLVNAAGAWVDEVARLAGVQPMGFTPLRRSMARLPAPGGRDLSRWPMVIGSGETWYAKPDAGALLVSPSEAEPCAPHDAWADDMVLAEGLARYEEMVTEPVTRLIANWAGLRTFAPDRNLVIGPDPQDPDFLWCAGQGGYGIQTAPAASQLLADLVAGHVPDLPDHAVTQLRPDRLRGTP